MFYSKVPNLVGGNREWLDLPDWLNCGYPVYSVLPRPSLSTVCRERTTPVAILETTEIVPIVRVLNALPQQRRALARDPTAVLFTWAWRHCHGADPRLAALPGHQRAQARL